MKRRLRFILIILLAANLAVSLFLLGRYAAELISAQREQEQLRALYLPTTSAAETAVPQLSAVPEETAAAEPAPVPAETAVPVEIPQSADEDTLPRIVYPDNPHGVCRSSMVSLWTSNSDTRGWLTVDELVDNAVMLRDNTYYLTHGTSGESNVNGALFLDEETDFFKNYRPYTLIIYGHNMKTGAMFGKLKKYTAQSWYQSHPFITFNTLYEDGRYVIFSVLTVNVSDSGAPDFLYIYQLYSDSAAERGAVLRAMKNRTHCANRIPVSGDDQVLLLVTCSGDSDERLVIAARRIREDETEDGLRLLAQ